MLATWPVILYSNLIISIIRAENLDEHHRLITLVDTQRAECKRLGKHLQNLPDFCDEVNRLFSFIYLFLLLFLVPPEANEISFSQLVLLIQQE